MGFLDRLGELGEDLALAEKILGSILLSTRIERELGLIPVAAQMFIYGGISVATSLGLSDWVIGVTIIAAGTSLPEFATSLAAMLKGRYGLSLGNITGSDIFNVLGVLGLTGMIRAVEVKAAATASLAGLCVMVLVTVLFPRAGLTLSRKEGLLLITLVSARWMLDLVSRARRCGAGGRRVVRNLHASGFFTAQLECPGRGKAQLPAP